MHQRIGMAAASLYTGMYTIVIHVVTESQQTTLR